MKRMDLLCASPSSTAICSSLDHRSMIRHGTRPIDSQNSKSYAPCSSQIPINPKSYYDKIRKSSAKQSDLHGKSSADNYSRESISSKKINELRRKSSVDISDLHIHSPTSSSRYLLSDKVPYIDWISAESDLASTLVTDPAHHRHNYHQQSKLSHIGSNQASARRRSSSSSEPNQNTKSRHSSSNYDPPALKSSSSARSRDQVVVLWVSIHCKGCEGKVRKHISKMEGVTSFSIDLATKKVTVIGNVTPLGVLASVSKVKNAQLWPSPSSLSISSSRRST